MSLLEIFESKAKNKNANIGIGLAELKDHNIKILHASLEFLKENKSTIYFFGNEIAISQIENNKDYTKNTSRIELIRSKNPEDEIFNFLKNNMINAIVRGNISSNKFLINVKELFNVSEITRLALLETYYGFQFFYGPVGIDECNTIDNKIKFINQAIKVLNFLNIEPKISILSGGRLGDMGRDPIVDKTISIAEEVVQFIKKENLNINISHDEILIENATNNKSNLIIAPDGISGNLIYRTLVHLGGGNAYGAIYMNLEKPIIDTSRVGKLSEIYGALILALALVK
jgi:putative methanogen marker protein 4